MHLTEEDKCVALRATIWISFIVAMGLSWRLWTGAHSVPQVPVINLPISQQVDVILCCWLVIALSAWVFFYSRIWITAALVAILGLALLDQMRWQPWAWQYTLMLLPFYFFRSEHHDDQHAAVLDVQRLIIAGIYFWSGVHKLGPGFRHMFRTYLASDVMAVSAPSLHPMILGGGELIPWIEIGIGIGLLIRISAPWAGGLAVITHLVIMIMIGPLGKNANTVVWPWNLGMMIMVGILFFNRRGIHWRPLFQGGFRVVTPLLILLVWVMPVLSTVQLWDRYLSFHLYSGRQQRIVVFFDKKASAQIPEELLRWTKKSPLPGYRELALSSWCMDELNVPVVSENRILLSMCKEVAELPITEGAWYFHHDYPHLVKERGWSHYSPQEIRDMDRFPPYQSLDTLRKE